MKKPCTMLFSTAFILLATSIAFAQPTVTSAPEGNGATTIYRQVMPDGRIVYSDSVTKGVKIDRILSVPMSKKNVVSKPSAATQMRGSGNPQEALGTGDTGR